MNAASSLWVRTRAGISCTATSLRLGASYITSSLSVVFYVLMGLSVALLLLCWLVILLGESEIFLRAPLGFKDESLTGIPALAELLEWPLAGGALVFWFVAWLFGSLSDRWRCTSHFYPGISDPVLRHAPRCSLMPGHSGQHFCEVSRRKYYWQPCVRCRELVSGSELCKKCRLPLAVENVLQHRESLEELQAQAARLEELARARLRAAGWDDSATLDGVRCYTLSDAVDAAMRETGATSLTQMGLVIKAARVRLGGFGK